VGTNPSVLGVYEKYWEAFEVFRSIPTIETIEQNQLLYGHLNKLLNAHLVVIPSLIRGIAESIHHWDRNDAEKFLTETMRSRIGRRVLAEQHIAFTESLEANQFMDHDLDQLIGVLDTNCLPLDIIQKCSKKAFDVVRETTGINPPKVLVNGHVDASFLYMPE
jgi:pyruvate dehydrogenase kinase 2/3/4